MNESPPPLPQKDSFKRLLPGMIIANLVGAGLFLGVAQLLAFYKGPNENSLAVPSLFLVPFVAGLTAAFCWRRLKRSIGNSALDALWTSLLGVAGAAVFMGEGVVCLVIAFPAVYGMIFLGLLAGRVCFKSDHTNLQLGLFPIFALFTAHDAFHRADAPA